MKQGYRLFGTRNTPIRTRIRRDTSQMLTEATVRSARPAPKAYKRYDERGMFLFVTPSGARLWRLKYRIFGKERLLALGAYPDVSLGRAREKRNEARSLVADGIDPGAKKEG